MSLNSSNPNGNGNGNANANADSTYNKKAKKEGKWEEEFNSVRQYLLQSPFGSSEAVAAALHGIDQESKRRHRDSKLHQKFSSTFSANSNKMVADFDYDCDYDCDAVKVERPLPNNSTVTGNSDGKSGVEAAANVNKNAINRESESMMMMTDDWQDVMTEQDNDVGTGTGTGTSDNEDNIVNSRSTTGTGSSYLGARWAKEAVTQLAANKVYCASPTAALAVALHATLLQAGFACTGVPEQVTQMTTGFAAPVRDLPPGRFMPDDWENGEIVQLRYRKEETGLLVLTVAPVVDDNMESSPQVKVSLAPSKEPNDAALQFALADHINLDSWNTAISRSGKGKGAAIAIAVSPVLHYKALATLLTKFAQYFDLGSDIDAVHADTKHQAGAAVYVDYTILHNRQRLNHPATLPLATSDPSHASQRRFPGPDVSVFDYPDYRTSVPVRPNGDFSGDLMPTGIYPFPGGMPMSPGNLMGPNHPMFSGGGMPGPAGFGSAMMRPRFDPFGPPGGPTEPDPDNLLNRPRNHDNNVRLPGGTGNPNNDLEKPPSLSNNHLFS